jgi:hypothetical protein
MCSLAQKSANTNWLARLSCWHKITDSREARVCLSKLKKSSTGLGVRIPLAPLGVSIGRTLTSSILLPSGRPRKPGVGPTYRSVPHRESCNLAAMLKITVHGATDALPLLGEIKAGPDANGTKHRVLGVRLPKDFVVGRFTAVNRRPGILRNTGVFTPVRSASCLTVIVSAIGFTSFLVYMNFKRGNWQSKGSLTARPTQLARETLRIGWGKLPPLLFLC